MKRLPIRYIYVTYTLHIAKLYTDVLHAFFSKIMTLTSESANTLVFLSNFNLFA